MKHMFLLVAGLGLMGTGCHSAYTGCYHGVCDCNIPAANYYNLHGNHGPANGPPLAPVAATAPVPAGVAPLPVGPAAEPIREMPKEKPAEKVGEPKEDK
jgi:hypothetical protein